MTANSKFVRPLFAGVDVGGTNVKIGVVDNDGQVVAETKFPTQPSKSPDVAIGHARDEFEKLLAGTECDWSDVVAAGLGTPGPMSVNDGMILTPTNLLGWHNFPIRSELSKALEKPVTYANDAAAAAFGEYWVGGGSDYASMVLLTLGTGVGGGIIVNDISIDGANSMGAEVGHMVIETGTDARVCGCGQPGHLEAYASATALVERTTEAMGETDSDTDSILRRQVGEASPLSALMISNAAAAGDELALKMVSETAGYLAKGIAQLAHIIDPEAFILGGAMNFGGSDTVLGQNFLAEIIQEARKLVFPEIGDHLIVKFAELAGEAGYVGAAGLARAEYNRTKS